MPSVVNSMLRYLAFMAAIFMGFWLHRSVMIYGSPFGGCDSGSLFVLNPHCGQWPDVLRGALLVLPISLLIRTRVQLAVAGLVISLLACLGGILGIRYGYHFEITSVTVVMDYFIVQLPETLASFSVLAIFFSAKRWWRNSNIARQTDTTDRLPVK